MLKTPKQLLGEELVCFQTKVPIREGSLGIGISLKKSPRTGLINYVNPTLDLMSMRAFTKLKIRKALAGERFTHWFPLYFGESDTYEIEEEHYDDKLEDHIKTVKKVDTKERFEKHLFNSVKFITTGSTKKEFNYEHVLEIMPKLITTHIVDMMKENRHLSMLAIRRLFNFIRILLYLMERDPKVQETMNERIKKFLDGGPEQRHKNNTPNLGDIQVFSLMSSKFVFEDIKQAYVDEQMDRQVLWMIREIPELDFENKKFKGKQTVDEKKRNEVCFEVGKTSFYFSLFFQTLSNTIEQVVGGKAKDFKKLSAALDTNHGCLSRDLENTFQQNLFAMLKTKNIGDYFKNLGFKDLSDKDIYARLIKSVKSSRERGYHGKSDLAQHSDKDMDTPEV
mmetsp:Transcript_34673/g.53119  ORF Transcript_34673/g.53119 Transcript_34673/m.53119 type:complete len:394 (-) Transcript_34673:2675-3856(-)